MYVCMYVSKRYSDINKNREITYKVSMQRCMYVQLCMFLCSMYICMYGDMNNMYVCMYLVVRL